MLKTFQHHLQRISLISGLIFLVAYSLPVIFLELPTEIIRTCTTLQILIWAIFVIDYLLNIFLAENKFSYFKSHLFELAAVALPALRPLRAIRALAVIVLLTQKSKGSRSQRLLANVASIAIGTWFISGLAITQVERNVPGSSIQTVRDGWWWSLETMTTVGYGDKLPITLEGQAVGAALMLIGIGLLGTITASLASLFLTTFDDMDTELSAEINENEVKLDFLINEVEKLNVTIASLRQDLKS